MPANPLILLIDDDANLRGIVTRAMSASFPAAAVVFLTSVAQARAYLTDSDKPLPRLILLDVHLDDTFTGFDVLALVRQKRRTFSIPVVMLTTDTSAHNVKKSYDAGASSFHVKPHSYAGWKDFLGLIRTYWFDTVQLPPKLHSEEEEDHDLAQVTIKPKQHSSW